MSAQCRKAPVPNRLAMSSALFVAALVATPCLGASTSSPIEHVIVVVGENRTFDNLFATYRPRPGQTVWNLLSQGIVREDGSPGPNFARAAQNKAHNEGAYRAMPELAGHYDFLPPTFAAGAFGQRHDVPDDRFPQQLPNGPYPIGKYVGYGAHTGDPVHRFFQMWQQVDGGANDLFVWTAETAGVGPDNVPLAPTPGATGQGGIAMGFFNMARGEAPYMKQLADEFALADNYHQPVMGGTTANYFALATGDVGVYMADGKPATPPARQIENPDSRRGTNNFYTADGYAGGTYVQCADPAAPGVAGVRGVLAKQPYRPFRDGNCDPGVYYMVNNLDPGFRADSSPVPLGEDKFVLPPQTLPHIGDALTQAGVSWKWYSGGRNDGRMTDKEYCGMCDTPTFFASTMKSSDKSRLQDLQQLYLDANTAETFPAVAFVAPYDSVSGHPGYATAPSFDDFLRGLIDRVRANPKLWSRTVILVTFDEGGGYYDSGYIQFIDFFGDGTRIPLLAVSPYARRGAVDHTYYDHASILKFIERNWHLSPLSQRSRDNLPNPKHVDTNPYVPTNRPAIGDLFNLFDFSGR